MFLKGVNWRWWLGHNEEAIFFSPVLQVQPGWQEMVCSLSSYLMSVRRNVQRKKKSALCSPYFSASPFLCSWLFYSSISTGSSFSTNVPTSRGAGPAEQICSRGWAAQRLRRAGAARAAAAGRSKVAVWNERQCTGSCAAFSARSVRHASLLSTCTDAQ